MSEEDKTVGEIEAQKKTESLKKLWEEKLGNMTFCHGTSVDVANRIKEKGLQPEGKPYDSDEQFYVENQAFLWGFRDNGSEYGVGKGGVFFLTVNENVACEYARMGPEIIRVYLLPTATDLQVKMAGVIDDPGNEGYREDFEKVKAIRQKWLESTWDHLPALVRIKRESESFKRLVDGNLSAEFALAVTDYDKFVELVKQYKNTGLEESEEEIGKMIINEIRDGLNNVPIKEAVLPEDFEVIEGIDFNNLNELNGGCGLIREKCFGGDRKQPAELIHFLYNVLFYNSGKTKELNGLCQYYGIDQKQKKIILEGLVNIRNELQER